GRSPRKRSLPLRAVSGSKSPDRSSSIPPVIQTITTSELPASMDYSVLFTPFERADAWLQGVLSGSPFLVAMVIAVALGLRHASDPDHLVAVTSLVAADGGETRSAAGLGGWWGAGHAAALVVIGLPLIALKSALPAWIEYGAERAVGVIIVLLALRVIAKWIR